MGTFNTTAQSSDADEFTTEERAAFLTSWGAAKAGGDSGQDFAAKNITADGVHGLLNTLDQYLNLCNGFDRSDGSLYINRLGATTPVQTMYFNKGNGVYNEYVNIVANSFTPFTGCHIIPKEDHDFKIGELICIEAIPNKDTKQPDWRGRYAKRNEKGIFGIVFQEAEESKPKPQIGVNKFYSIACLGDMKILCNNENGDIKYGDELTPSSVKGQAMKADENIHRRKVCGIAGRSHTFTSSEAILLDTTKE